jgi:hypothetical protein
MYVCEVSSYFYSKLDMRTPSNATYRFSNETGQEANAKHNRYFFQCHTPCLAALSNEILEANS